MSMFDIVDRCTICMEPKTTCSCPVEATAHAISLLGGGRMTPAEANAYDEFRAAAVELKAATATFNAAQERYRAAVAKLSAVAAP